MYNGSVWSYGLDFLFNHSFFFCLVGLTPCLEDDASDYGVFIVPPIFVGHHINYYIDRLIYEQLEEYADEKGQTMTMALERILKEFFERTETEQAEKQ